MINLSHLIFGRIGETAPEAMRVRRETIVNELLQVEDDVKYRIQLCDWSNGMQQNRVEGWRDWFLGTGPPNKGVNPTTLARVVAAAKRALELAF